jgi:transposase
MSQDAPVTIAAELPADEVSLPDDPAVLQRMIRELLTTLQQRDQQLAGVQHRLDLLLRRLYGPKAERFDPNQPTLFDGLTPPPQPVPAAAPPAEANGAAATPARRPNGHGRKRLPDNLPRHRREYDLNETEKLCPCCQTPRLKIGEEISEQLDYQPASLFVIQHVRFKYACPRCAATADPVAKPEAAPTVVTAPKPAQPIDKGLPGPGLLAQVTVAKFVDHLPLHRQVPILARHGIALSRSTMCDWMAACAVLLTPLYQLLIAQVLASRTIHTDDTKVPVQEPGQDRTKSGRLWVYIGDRDHAATVYAYTPTHARDGPAKFLKGFQGFLQADAANLYDGIYAPGGIVEVGCWAHGRRHFHEARDTDAARAHEALARIAALYAVEDEARELIDTGALSADAADALRLRLRQEKTLPLLSAFSDWLQQQEKQVLPKSPIGQAIAYALRHWSALKRFTQHGFLNIDNNAAERALRGVAIGRKNWLFAGSDAGGQTAAVLYSIVATCKQLGIEPFGYLKDVLARLPEHPAEARAELLPANWAKSQREQADQPA